MKNTYILRNKSTGWFLTAGQKHTSDPASIPSHLRFSRGKELSEALEVFGSNYESVNSKKALPVA